MVTADLGVDGAQAGVWRVLRCIDLEDLISIMII